MDRGAYKVISTIIIMFTFIICVDELKACPLPRQRLSQKRLDSTNRNKTSNSSGGSVAEG
jgi:hypothetical protein